MIQGMREGFGAGPIVSEATDDRVVLTQGMSRAYKVITWMFAIFFALFVPVIIWQLVADSVTGVKCDRSTDKCEMYGYSHRKFAVSEVASAEVINWYQHKVGDSVCVQLTMTDGKKQDISPYCAIDKTSAATYETAVAAINKFLADKTQQKLDTSWAYRSTIFESLRGIFGEVLAIIILLFLIKSWRTRTITFDKVTKKVTTTTKLLRGKPVAGTDEVPLEEFADFEAIPGCIVEATRNDGTKTKFLFTASVASAEKLAADLKTVVG
ncbi:MAG TPA: hypothetical protein VGM90_27780 [Kofleriaceae bacterium]|jgi:hypothetical protein